MVFEKRTPDCIPLFDFRSSCAVSDVITVVLIRQAVFSPFRVVLAKLGMLGHLLEELNIHNWLTDLLYIMNRIHNREQIIWYDFSQQWLDGL